MTIFRVAISSRIHGQVIERLRSSGEIVGNRAPEPWTHEELIANARHAHALLAFMPDRADDGALNRPDRPRRSPRSRVDSDFNG